MSDEEELYKAANMGDLVAAFLDTDVYRMIEATRVQEENDALEALIAVNPFEYNTLGELQSAIAKLQENVLLARKLTSYLEHAISRASEAEQLLESQED